MSPMQTLRKAKKLTKQYYAANTTAVDWLGQVIGAARESASSADDDGDGAGAGAGAGDDLGTDLINSFGYDADLKAKLEANIEAFDSANLPGVPAPSG